MERSVPDRRLEHLRNTLEHGPEVEAALAVVTDLLDLERDAAFDYLCELADLADVAINEVADEITATGAVARF
ncbi:MAG: hypothetical protein HOQ22_05270 [Nocardioidaceae bacterium]|nr:hypothetical protein [Nocardioidaceae bacterium]NUS50437.1 hypothetical protein [Nocardioidaceae bacterium]